VVNITGMILNEPTSRWSASPEYEINLLWEGVVSMAGTSGQHHQRKWSRWIGLYTILLITNILSLKTRLNSSLSWFDNSLKWGTKKEKALSRWT
jgi:hypothetical protein